LFVGSGGSFGSGAYLGGAGGSGSRPPQAIRNTTSQLRTKES
jgi:hypothetical protein